MKKNLLAALLFLVGFSVHAQPISMYAYDQLFSAGNSTIVRSWGTNRVFAYYETTTRQYIDLLESTSSYIHRVILPEYLYFNDIFVENDIAYFCGASTENITYSVGIVGYIDLNEMLTSNVTFHYITDNNLTSVNKLVEYDDFGAKHVVGIGEERSVTPPYSYIRHYVVDCPDIMSPTPIPFNRAPFTADERYFDMVLTNSYVVFTGYNILTAMNAICARKCHRGATFGILLDTLHVYSTGATEAYSALHSTALEGDKYAISYLNIDATPVTRIRTFNAASNTLDASQQFYLLDKSEPKEMIYVPYISKIVLLQDFQYLSTTDSSNFVDIDPWPTGTYAAQLEYMPNARFNSLTTVDGHNFIAGIGTAWLMRDKFYTPTGVPDVDCPVKTEIRVDTVKTTKYYNVLSPIVPVLDPKTLNDVPENVNNSNQVTNFCENN